LEHQKLFGVPESPSKELLGNIVTLNFFLGHDATSVEVDAGSMIKVAIRGGGGTVVERDGLMCTSRKNTSKSTKM